MCLPLWKWKIWPFFLPHFRCKNYLILKKRNLECARGFRWLNNSMHSSAVSIHHTLQFSDLFRLLVSFKALQWLLTLLSSNGLGPAFPPVNMLVHLAARLKKWTPVVLSAGASGLWWLFPQRAAAFQGTLGGWSWHPEKKVAGSRRMGIKTSFYGIHIMGKGESSTSCAPLSWGMGLLKMNLLVTWKRFVGNAKRKVFLFLILQAVLI